ncbi:MAG: hypothetical protein JW742_02260 [Candidatus Aminicenantes bacterium]|nr:hypothetical protein [Candidatus Aminicenantes bacterium]
MTPPRRRVILRRAPAYDPEAIARIVREGIAAFGLAERIKGKVTIKPSVVFAHHKVAPSAFTHPEFIDGLVSALKAEAAGTLEIAVSEKCGAAVPTISSSTPPSSKGSNPWTDA